VIKQLNITPTRHKALEYLAGRPGGVYVGALADHVLTSEYRRQIKSGFTAQQSTRSGAGLAVPLIRAGLVHKRNTTYGWGIVSLTDAGHKLVAALKAANAASIQTLDAVLARCVED